MDSLKKVKLIRRSSSADSLGDVTFVESSREVYAKVTSSSQREWFEAYRDDIKSVFKLIIYSFEYHDEQIVEMDGKRYSVYRTYEKSRDKIELYLEQKAGTEHEH